MLNPTVSNGKWVVGYQTGHGVPTGKIKLSVFRTRQLPLIGQPKCEGHIYRTLFQRATIDGEIIGQDEFREYMLFHGFLKVYNRNMITFHSSRTFRKHTGFDNIHQMRGEEDVLWDCHVRIGKVRGDR